MSKHFLKLALSILIIIVGNSLFSRSVVYAQEPPEYQWHTFYGGSGLDNGFTMNTDADGNIYLSGSSDADWNGPNGEAPLNAYSGGGDMVIVKLDSSGVYQWHIFYGGDSHLDGVYDISLDDNGNIYLTGFSNGPWNGPNGEDPLNPHANPLSMTADIVVVKLNSSGVYQWHTFYGSYDGGTYDWDEGRALDVDTNGDIYITGHSGAAWQGPNDEMPLNPYTDARDIFVLKLNSDGIYKWHTFYGRRGYGYGLSLDASGNVYLAGDSKSWIGPNGEAPLNAYTDNDDIVIIKLDSNGTYQWHTFYGSEHGDSGRSLSLDTNDNIYLSGVSPVSWDGPNGEAPLNAYTTDENASDVAIIKLDNNGAYQWHTFYNGSNGYFGANLRLDANSNVYLIGDTNAPWQGPDDTDPLHAYTGDYDIMMVNLDNNGTYQWHTFFGGDGFDFGGALSLDDNGNIYLTGSSTAAWDGPDEAAPLNPYIEDDIYLLKLSPTATTPAIDVRGNNLHIPSGDTNPSPADGTDFGEVLAGSGSLTHTFTILNNGSATLTIDSVSLSGDTGAFSVASQPNSPIVANGGSTTFDLRFAPAGSGLYTAIVSLSHNASDPSPYTFTIRGAGLEPPTMSDAVIYLPVIIKSCCQ